MISAYFGVTLQFVNFMSLDDHDRLDWSHLKMSHGSFAFEDGAAIHVYKYCINKKD